MWGNNGCGLYWLFSHDVTTKGTTKFLFQFLYPPAKQIVKENFVVILCFHSQIRFFEFDTYCGRAKESNILLMKTKIIAKRTGLSKPITNERSQALIKETSDFALTKLRSYYEHN